MRLRLKEGLALHVVPAVLRDVAAVDEHFRRRPVRRLPGQPVTAFEQQYALARRGEVARERAAARPGSDHDGVVTFGHVWLLSHRRAPAAGCQGRARTAPVAL